MTCGGAFGSGGFGSLSFGSGASLHVVSATQHALNAVDVVFSVPPAAAGAWVPSDVLNPASWTVIPQSVGSGDPRLVQFVERLTNETFRLFLDYTLTPGIVYVVTAAVGMLDEYGLPISSGVDCRSATFLTFAPARAGIPGAGALDARNDLRNPQYRFDGSGRQMGLGTLQRDDSGDLAIENGVPYLRKRVIRRITTAAGEFFHLPGYGVGVTAAVKTLAKPTQLARIQRAAQVQIMQESDVTAARVTVSSPTPGVYVFAVKIRTVAGLIDDFTTTVTIGSGISNA